MLAELFGDEGFSSSFVDVEDGVVKEVFVSVNCIYVQWRGCGVLRLCGGLSYRVNG